MSLKPLTILTDPIPFGRYMVSEILKKIYRYFRNIIIGIPKGQHSFYRGHFAVTRSLLQGLDNCKYEYVYNPNSIHHLTDTVLVLSGVKTLEQAVQLKEQGVIKKLLAGPNIIIFSSDHNSLIANRWIDAVITPAEIINELYVLDNPTLKGRILSWPAGVNTNYWKPDDNKRKNQILIYEKQVKGPVGPISPYVDYLQNSGYDVRVIQYGSYSLVEYLSELQKSILMIGFVTDESQGIAWAEAWSSDVPTFIWNNHTNVYRGRSYLCSTAPYLTDDNGIFFDNFNDFQIKFNQWEKGHFKFQPRKWCLENMSDEVCAQKLIDIVHSIENTA